MKRTRVEFDLNSINGDGLTRVRLRNADGALLQGQMVTAFQPEDEVKADAYVHSVDVERGIAYLRVNRETMTDDVDPAAVPIVVSASNTWSRNVGGRFSVHRRASRGTTETIIGRALTGQINIAPSSNAGRYRVAG